MKKITNSNLNKQYHVGADPVSGQNAITLVALVITVIILLILAGVTINLTLGNNGIFQTAQKAAKNYTDAQNKELADLKDFENIVNGITQDLKYDPSLSELKTGDYVKYDTGVSSVGNNGIVIFKVLYDTKSPYGLQIISNTHIGNDITIGGDDWEAGKAGYNDAITILNNEAMKYKNNIYAVDARCVGSNPANKNDDTKTTVKLPLSDWTSYKRPTGWTTDDTECKDEDADYEIDYNAMKSANIINISKNYWLASRKVYRTSARCYFQLNYILSNGELSQNQLCRVYSDGPTYGVAPTFALRICISLKPDIKVVSGDGKTEESAYVLGIE